MKTTTTAQIALIAAMFSLGACETAPQSAAEMAETKSEAVSDVPADMVEMDMNEDAITGETVAAVAFANGGRLAMSGDKEWTEYDSKTGQAAFVFTESHRDDWSVYLKQIDDPKRLQIDIHRMMLGYTGGDADMIDLYQIESASLTAPTPLSKYVYEGVNGANLAKVSFGDKKAKFKKTGDKIWTEYNEDGESFNTFTETHRDEWSVYLNDAGRNIRIQLDVHREMILLGQNGGDLADQWIMTGAAKLRDNLTDAAG